MLSDQRQHWVLQALFAVLQATVQAQWALPPMDAQWLQSTMLT